MQFDGRGRGESFIDFGLPFLGGPAHRGVRSGW
jgi:hypothetical protein